MHASNWFVGHMRALALASAFLSCQQDAQVASELAVTQGLTSSSASPLFMINNCLAEARRRSPAATAAESVLAARLRTAACAAGVKAENQAYLGSLRQIVAKASCEQRPREELSSLAYLMTIDPILASIEAIDCLIASSAIEDVVIWDALDAWVTIGRPGSGAVSALEAQSKSFATKRRFMNAEDAAMMIRQVPVTQELTATIMNDKMDEQ